VWLIVQAMKVLSRAVGLAETLYIEAPKLAATDTVSYAQLHNKSI